jgi:aspartyl-tRNA(Asn)/glutamyl-tRNA(Gln) amidotransferase subunit A
MSELLFMSAAEAASLIRTRRLSPVEYIDAVLAASEAAQGRLNAYVTILHESARAAAKEAERAVMAGAPLGPLHGVAVNVKDQIDVAGVRTTHGSAIHAENVATRDDILVARLKQAGAIIVGKSTLPEFGHKGLTDGPSFGITRNPWNLARTPGGSSGGAAALVASGVTPIGLGTDGAGSIRIPAACCGLVGLKCTLGAIPWETAADAFANYTYAGPLARTVTDAAQMFGVLAGPSPHDPWSHGRAQPRLSAALIGEDLRGLRVGTIRLATNARVDASWEANTRASLDVFAALGAEIESVEDEIDWIEQPGRVMYQSTMTVAFARHLPQWREKMDPVLLAYMERGGAYDLADLRNAQFARTRLFRAIEMLLERYDVLVTPTLTRSALPVGFDGANDEVEIEGVKSGITRQGWSCYVYPFNLTGHPALAVPSGFAADGLPSSVQLVGRWGADLDLFRLGAMLERARPWAQHRPPVS